MRRELWFLLIYGNLMGFTGFILQLCCGKSGWLLLLQAFGLLMVIYCCIISYYDYRQMEKRADKIKKEMQKIQKEFEETLNNFKINHENNTKGENEQ